MVCWLCKYSFLQWKKKMDFWVTWVQKQCCFRFRKYYYIFAWLTPKRYRDLKCYCYWSGIKKDVATFVLQCQTCHMVKVEHQVPKGLLQNLSLPLWNGTW